MSDADLAAFLTADAATRAQMIEANPDLFTEEVLEALNEADELRDDSLKIANELKNLMSDLNSELGLPSSGGGPLGGIDESDLEGFQQDEYFRQVLSNLLKMAPLEEQSRLNTKRPMDAAGQPAGSRPAQNAKVIALQSVLPRVVEYLPVKSVFLGCECTCRGWRKITRPTDDDGGLSSALWIGLVQREYPQQLSELLESDEEGKMLATNWRTIARVLSSG